MAELPKLHSIKLPQSIKNSLEDHFLYISEFDDEETGEPFFVLHTLHEPEAGLLGTGLMIWFAHGVGTTEHFLRYMNNLPKNDRNEVRQLINNLNNVFVTFFSQNTQMNPHYEKLSKAAIGRVMEKKNYLINYYESSFFHDIFSFRRYNCVTGTALIALGRNSFKLS